MPMLVLILGERLGLDITLSTAPLHVFAKWTDPESGATYNFEATSGRFARDRHIRNDLPMTDEAIANGVYMKTLTRREALAVMAETALDHLYGTRRYHDVIAVADVILEAYPTHAYALVKKGSAYAKLLQPLIIRKVGILSEVRNDMMSYAEQLSRANGEAFDRAEALGWREIDLDRIAEVRARMGEQ